jgi:hypothetical protein
VRYLGIGVKTIVGEVGSSGKALITRHPDPVSFDQVLDVEVRVIVRRLDIERRREREKETEKERGRDGRKSGRVRERRRECM